MGGHYRSGLSSDASLNSTPSSLICKSRCRFFNHRGSRCHYERKIKYWIEWIRSGKKVFYFLRILGNTVWPSRLITHSNSGIQFQAEFHIYRIGVWEQCCSHWNNSLPVVKTNISTSTNNKFSNGLPDLKELSFFIYLFRFVAILFLFGSFSFLFSDECQVYFIINCFCSP